MAGALAVALVAASVALRLADGGSLNPYWRPQAVNGVLYGILGAYIAVRRPAQRLGWVLVVAGLGFALTAFSSHYALPVDSPPYERPLASIVLWLGSWTWAVSLGLTTNVALLIFPDGRLPSRRWWPAAFVSAAGTAVMAVALAVSAWGIGPDNPEPDGRVLARYQPLGSRLLLVGSVLAAVSLVVRYAHRSGHERTQIGAVTVAGIGVAVGTVASWTTNSVGSVEDLVGPLAVGAMAFALLRHRLYDIDVVVNRTLVYAGLSIGVAATYAATVALFAFVGTRSDLAPPLVASIAVALVFAPVRDRLQRGVNRLLYGDRHDPFAATERLGQRLEAAIAPEAALDAVVEAVGEALRVPAVTLETPAGDGFAELAGYAPTGAIPGRPDVVRLLYQGELVGRLVVWPRGPGQALSRADRRVVEGLAHQIAVVVHAARVSAELRRSRERLVNAREEERRRIRRDLHDGLGARLSGVVLGLQASRNLLSRDTERVSRLLAELCADTQQAIADVRRLVYDLRPPALDELGLVPAIREHAATLDGAGAGPADTELSVHVDAPDDLGPLPAAVEVAVYWIAVEALTNVVRHADARTCLVRISRTPSVELEVSDDGRGLPPAWRAGVGLSSMRERAGELGGSLSIGPGLSDRGTRVVARVPAAQTVAA
ncbi:MAG: GAF domain-containing sensor histidine kinase [Actinomycetota bacterium]|nr:GAF domain-containing sensor histidine kinase [Actinomycetota bacterium]